MQIGRDGNQLIILLEGYLRNQGERKLHYAELAKIFKRLRKVDNDSFKEYIKRMPSNVLGDILLEINEKALEEALEVLSIKKIVNAIKYLESDDATDLLEDIEELRPEVASEILQGMDKKDKEEIELLRSYGDDQAGSYMQIEVFTANHRDTVKQTIERFREQKISGDLENVSAVFIKGDYNNLVASILLEDLILFNLGSTFKEVLEKKSELYKARYVRDIDDIEEVATMFKEYDLSVVPVIDDHGYIMGRITSDDIYDILQELATEQIYNLAGVDEEAEGEKKVMDISRKRGKWQFLNMCTAFFSASVIGRYQDTIDALPALAVLMPIVASMGGNTGNQALTVMVRQLAMGDVDISNWDRSLLKEVGVALLNGLLFAFLVGLGSFLWFKNINISYIISIAIFVNFIMAGICGTMIPLLLKKFKTDPAVGSSILLTMITDALGFLVFLGLAKIFLF